MSGYLTLGEFMLYAALPMMEVQVFIVWGYLLHAARLWPRMPRREAIGFAPLVVPFTFLCFFLPLHATSPTPFSEVARPLLALTLVTWLAGIVTGETIYRRVKRSLNGT